MMRALLVPVLLAACTPAIQGVAGIREAQASEITNCAFVGNVIGKPEAFGPLTSLGIQGARKAALEKGAELGGNTVVFDPIPVGNVPVTELPARVYRC